MAGSKNGQCELLKPRCHTLCCTGQLQPWGNLAITVWGCSKDKNLLRGASFPLSSRFQRQSIAPRQQELLESWCKCLKCRSWKDLGGWHMGTAFLRSSCSGSSGSELFVTSVPPFPGAQHIQGAARTFHDKTSAQGIGSVSGTQRNVNFLCCGKGKIGFLKFFSSFFVILPAK